MARGLLSDDLLVHNFHLLDIGWSVKNVPPFVLWPSAGFSSITAPEMTIETDEVTEGTFPFRHHVLKKASIGSITLSRGSTMFRSDFWRWIMACLKGTSENQSLTEFLSDLAQAASLIKQVPTPGKRRNLALIHLSNISVDGLKKSMSQGGSLDKLKAIAALPSAGVAYTIQAVEELTQGFVDFGITSIPAKVWILINCLPVRYKAASDFDASSTEVSIQELEIAVERIEEFNMLA